LVVQEAARSGLATAADLGEERLRCSRPCMELLELARDGEARCRTDCVPEGRIFGYDARGGATRQKARRLVRRTQTVA